MKVKAGGIVYDSDIQPVMVILTKQDKRNIANMSEKATKYCVFDEDKNSLVDINKFMESV